MEEDGSDEEDSDRFRHDSLPSILRCKGFRLLPSRFTCPDDEESVNKAELSSEEERR
jgi:hypothetical protein